MHHIEPYYRWRTLYTTEEDADSPFFEKEYSEFEFSDAIYDHYIHPQWDEFGSSTLFLKILFADYDDGFVIIEFIGEWNDLLHNDIMVLKRNIVEPLMDCGISKFILLGENILNAHIEDDDYYEEWFDECDDMGGWICLLNFREHVLEEFENQNIDSYFVLGGEINLLNWRTYSPENLFEKVDGLVQRRLNGQ